MIGRIAPPRDLEGLLDRFTTPDAHGVHALFETKQKVLMFAAALGRRRGSSLPLDRKGVAIRYDIFERALDDGFIDALSIATTDDLKVLSPERADERIRIFEEYAHAGLVEMEERCFNQTGDPLEELIAIVDEQRQGPSEGLTGIDPGILSKLLK
ncbi:DNA phosphorothioation-associated protein 4 [Caulobacter sp. CCNWLY153]|uniref:DNA phosphorothioation-associated protein 4 n=1 Tax=unclassified Caulobacter TaxID=2648921 RepID=UPI002FF1EB8D